MKYSEEININTDFAPDKSFYKILQRDVPLWSFGTEERNLRFGFEKLLNALPDQTGAYKKISYAMKYLDWQQFPFDFCEDEIINSLFRNNPVRIKKILALKQACNLQSGIKLPAEDLNLLIESQDTALIIRHLMPLLHSGNSLQVLMETWEKLLRLGNAELPLSALDMTIWPQGTEPLRQRLLAQHAFLYGSANEAYTRMEQADGDIWGLWKNYIKAELLIRSGETQKGAEILAALWKTMPWHINWALKLHTLLNPAPEEHISDASDEVSILLYSWNNAELIRQTIANLSRTNIGKARIFVLNNGSDDETGKIMDQSAELFDDGKYSVTHLQVNVGAPAARNWLLSLPEVRKSKWAVFLDDDVMLPENWLVQLLATAKAYPDAGAIGCRITSASDPLTLQSADYHLFQPGDGTSQINGLSEYIMIHDNCRSAFDYGQFSYCRPALHLSGCCHMLSMAAVNSCGAFDVRFNPTQFDDLERDMRAYLSGKQHIYAGQLAIRHIQHSSLAKAASTKSMAQVFGNKIKLEGLFNQEELSKMSQRDTTELWQDINFKLKELENYIS